MTDEQKRVFGIIEYAAVGGLTKNYADLLIGIAKALESENESISSRLSDANIRVDDLKGKLAVAASDLDKSRAMASQALRDAAEASEKERRLTVRHDAYRDKVDELKKQLATAQRNPSPAPEADPASEATPAEEV